MDLSGLHRGKHKAKLSGAPRKRRLSEMAAAEIEALPESEFARLLSGKVRRAYLASRKLKGRL